MRKEKSKPTKKTNTKMGTGTTTPLIKEVGCVL